jgi:hypothetical protein
MLGKTMSIKESLLKSIKPFSDASFFPGIPLPRKGPVKGFSARNKRDPKKIIKQDLVRG